jgi:hypothetical protein
LVHIIKMSLIVNLECGLPRILSSVDSTISATKRMERKMGEEANLKTKDGETNGRTRITYPFQIGS